jgi:hypothetical protein
VPEPGPRALLHPPIAPHPRARTEVRPLTPAPLQPLPASCEHEHHTLLRRHPDALVRLAAQLTRAPPLHVADSAQQLAHSPAAVSSQRQ